MLVLFTISSLILSSVILVSGRCWESNQATHTPQLPSTRVLRYLVGCLGEEVDMETILAPLLITRTPGSAGNAAAREYISSFLTELGWTMEYDTFTQDTVVGKTTFSNILATLHPDSPRRLVVAAHYDTKISPEGFLGATDSAVPCAMLLHLAQVLGPLLPPPDTTPELTLQLVFFDGEEAFKSWTNTDSLYGSRHLATQWASTQYQYQGEEGICQEGSATEMDRVDMFLLLDLLGAPSPSFRRYTQFNTSLYDLATSVEIAVNKLPCTKASGMFTRWDANYMIQDDQVPFYNAGLRRILHMIASPFPSVWHTLRDNKDALDMDTINTINKILRVFTYSYFNAS